MQVVAPSEPIDRSPGRISPAFHLDAHEPRRLLSPKAMSRQQTPRPLGWDSESWSQTYGRLGTPRSLGAPCLRTWRSRTHPDNRDG